LCLFQINKNRKKAFEDYEDSDDCHLKQTGILFTFIEYPLFRFKCEPYANGIERFKYLHWGNIITINFKVNQNLTQISAELWQIILYRINPDCGEPERIFNSIENDNS